jgi:SAM-dependent methyltransferase
MKLIPYFPWRAKFDDEIVDIASEVNSKLTSIYGEDKLQDFKLCSIFQFGDPKDKRILEIGCGSKNSKDNFFHKGTFEPWLLRALHEYGTNPVGIDIAGLEGELFEGYSIDLSKEESLNLFQDNSFDIVCAYSFFNSPFLNDHCDNSGSTFNSLIPQLERIIKPDGYFIFDVSETKFEKYNYQ